MQFLHYKIPSMLLIIKGQTRKNGESLKYLKSFTLSPLTKKLGILILKYYKIKVVSFLLEFFPSIAR